MTRLHRPVPLPETRSAKNLGLLQPAVAFRETACCPRRRIGDHQAQPCQCRPVAAGLHDRKRQQAARSPRRLAALFLFASLACCTPTPDFHRAQNLSAKPFNQLDLAGNACGPAALLNSSRFGSPEWRKISETPPALSDRERIRAIARGPAMRESSSLPGRARWSRAGINLSDLRDVANEMARPAQLPLISETLVISPIESKEAHLRRIHGKLARSLAAGVPPVVSLRLYAKRNGTWTQLQSHFVTVTSIPGRLDKGASSFPVGFIDPLGGKSREGRITPGSDPGIDYFAEAIFPSINIGKNSLRPGEKSYLAIAGVLGRL